MCAKDKLGIHRAKGLELVQTCILVLGLIQVQLQVVGKSSSHHQSGHCVSVGFDSRAQLDQLDPQSRTQQPSLQALVMRCLNLQESMVDTEMEIDWAMAELAELAVPSEIDERVAAEEGHHPLHLLRVVALWRTLGGIHLGAEAVGL